MSVFMEGRHVVKNNTKSENNFFYKLRESLSRMLNDLKVSRNPRAGIRDKGMKESPL